MTEDPGTFLSGLRERSRALFAELGAAPDEASAKQVRDALIELHLPLAEHCARRFAQRGEPFEDLVQVGTVGLIKAVDRFEPKRGVEFSTYATPTIIGEIKRHFRDKGWAIRVPRRLQELRMSIANATGELSQSLGHSPTPREIADRLDITVEEVLEGIESANAYATLSLDAGEGGDESLSWLETLGAEDEALENVEIRESLRPLLASLPPREQTILVLRFFRQQTQTQIAEQLGISQMHVSRLLTRTLERLRSGIS